MKKLVSIVLSLVLALTACVALATDSPANLFTMVILEGEDVPAWVDAITEVEGAEDATLVDVVPMQAFNYTPDLGDQTIVVLVDCDVAAGQEIAVVIGEEIAEDNILWTPIAASVIDTNTVEMVFTSDLLIELGEEPFAVALLTK